MSSLLTFVPVFFSELNPTPPLFGFSLCFSLPSNNSFSLNLSFALNFLITKAPTNIGCICCSSFFTTPLHTPWKYAFCCFYSFLLKVAGCLLNKEMPLPLFFLSTASLQHFTPFTETFLIPSFPSFVWCGNISSLWDFSPLFVLVSNIPSVNVQYYLVPLNQRIFSLYKHLYTHPHQIFPIIWFSHEIVRKLNLPPNYLIKGLWRCW